FVTMRKGDGLPRLTPWHLEHPRVQLVADLRRGELQSAEARRRVAVAEGLGELADDPVRGGGAAEFSLRFPPEAGEGRAVITGHAGIEHALRLRHGGTRVVQRLLLARLEQVVAADQAHAGSDD